MTTIKSFQHPGHLIFFLLWSISPSLIAQTANIRALQEVLDTTSNDSIRMDALFDLAWEYSRRNPQKALELAKAGKTLSDSMGDPFWMAFSNYYLGAVYKNLGEFPAALQHFNILRRYLEENPDTLRYTNTLYQLAVVKKELDDTEGALADFNETITLFQKLGDQRSVAMTLNAKATILKNIGNYDAAFAAYEKALDTYRAARDTIGMSDVLNNMGNAYSLTGKYEEALSCYNLQESYGIAMNSEYGLGYVYENRGRLYNRMGKLDLAVSELEKSFEIRRRFDDKNTLSFTQVEMARVLCKLSRFEEAIHYARTALELAQRYQLIENKRDAYQILSLIYERQEKYPEALSAFRKYEELKDSILNESISAKIVEMDARFESAQKEAEIDQLKLAEEMATERLYRHRQMIVGAGILVLLLTAFLILIYRQKNVIKSQNKIIRSALAGKELLLREIHHRIKNNLQVISSLLNIQSRRVKDQAAREVMREGRSRVQSMSLIHQNLYHHENLSGINMNSYIEQLVDGLRDSYRTREQGISIRTQVNDITLDVDTVVPIGLIVNELITNALKYAFPSGGGNIEVVLREQDNELYLSVSDDGVGKSDGIEGGDQFGYNLIHAFATKLKTKIRIDTGTGTLVSAKIPSYQKLAS